MAKAGPPSGKPPVPGDQTPPAPAGGKREEELLKVVVTRDGRKVSAQWAIHPLMKQDLTSEEFTRVTELMAKVTSIVGQRFANILSEAEPDRPGTA